jgi:radical SAM superfamily enzyme with C-terminal helix-hairpin-helix motif
VPTPGNAMALGVEKAQQRVKKKKKERESERERERKQAKMTDKIGIGLARCNKRVICQQVG